MAEKCALIVDDSRTARQALERMLSAHELQVDAAESAEAALEYLSGHRPDVIFMDHMMPGMDGFEAVQAIKANPATATIPIMMYTSQEGELYVGQARALGAVGVLPKQIEPVEVSRVLRSLRLIPGVSEDTLPANDADVTITDTQQVEQLVAGDAELRELIRSMFEQQRSVLRRDLLDSYEAIAARVAEEISPESDAETDVERLSPRLHGLVTTALVFLGLTAIVFAALYWRAEGRWQQERAARAELSARLLENQSLTADGTLAMQANLSESQSRVDAVYQESLDLIQWAFNQGGAYPWGQAPLSDALTAQLEQLTARLQSIGFSGTLLIETHVGDYCVAADSSGNAILPMATAPITECAQIGQSAAAAEQSGQEQSVAFANLVETIGQRTDGSISIALSTLGNTDPAVTYPPLSESLTAGEWNAQARKNNRVVISLLPDF